MTFRTPPAPLAPAVSFWRYNKYQVSACGAIKEELALDRWYGLNNKTTECAGGTSHGNLFQVHADFLLSAPLGALSLDSYIDLDYSVPTIAPDGSVQKSVVGRRTAR